MGGGPSNKYAYPYLAIKIILVNLRTGIAVNLISMLFFVHVFFPTARHHTVKFFQISYYNPKTGTFALGWDDIFFVFFWIIVFTGMRVAVMDYILTPLSSWLGLKRKKMKVRFAEQAWILIYYTLIWFTGMYIMYNSDYWLNLRALWRDWPVREMEGFSKWYYLVQFAFYLQQIVVVNIEERRKDHWQMFTHHIITCALIFGAYGYHQTKVGNLILCLMDVVDLFLPLAKILKYLKFQLPCDACFGIFMVTWLIARHICYMAVCWSIYAHIPQEIQYGCYTGSVTDLKGPYPTPNDWGHLIEPFQDPVGLVCWNNNIKWTFLGMLLALQCILLGWFAMIIRVAYKVLTGQGAEDTRSEDEDEEDDEEETIEAEKGIESIHLCVEPQPFVEKEVLSTDANFTFLPPSKPSRAQLTPSPVRRSNRRRPDSGSSSGVNRLGGSDRKELLGRIGCDKSLDDD